MYDRIISILAATVLIIETPGIVVQSLIRKFISRTARLAIGFIFWFGVPTALVNILGQEFKDIIVIAFLLLFAGAASFHVVNLSK